MNSSSMKLCLFAFLIVMPRLSTAATIIGNYPPNNDFIGVSLTGRPITGLRVLGAGFGMPTGSNYQLDSITLRMQVSGTPILRFELFGDVGGNPGGPTLVSFISPTFTGGINDFTFLPSSPFTLLSGNTYWFAVTGLPGSGGSEWKASAPSIVPTGIATSAGYRRSETGEFPPTGVTFTNTTYRVEGTELSAIPEPSSLFLLGSGLLAISTHNRKRNRSVR